MLYAVLQRGTEAAQAAGAAGAPASSPQAEHWNALQVRVVGGVCDTCTGVSVGRMFLVAWCVSAWWGLGGASAGLGCAVCAVYVYRCFCFGRLCCLAFSRCCVV